MKVAGYFVDLQVASELASFLRVDETRYVLGRVLAVDARAHALLALLQVVLALLDAQRVQLPVFLSTKRQQSNHSFKYIWQVL